MALYLLADEDILGLGTEYRRGERHVYRHIAGEHLLIALHRDAVAPMFAFTATAAFLWKLLGEWSTASRLTEDLMEQFEVSLEQAAKDVADFLEQLRTIGALETREI